MPIITAEQYAAHIANLKQQQQSILPIDPNAIAITGIEGVGGGGDLTQSRQLYLEIQGLNFPAVYNPNQSYIAIYDASDGTHRQIPASEVASAGADKHYTHLQAVPSITWTIAHGLFKYPSVITVDSAGSQMFGLVEYLDLNTVRVTFSIPLSGEAYLN